MSLTVQFVRCFSEVEFYVVFVLVEPGIEQEGLEAAMWNLGEGCLPAIDSLRGGARDGEFMKALGVLLENVRASPLKLTIPANARKQLLRA